MSITRADVESSKMAGESSRGKRGPAGNSAGGRSIVRGRKSPKAYGIVCQDLERQSEIGVVVDRHLLACRFRGRRAVWREVSSNLVFPRESDRFGPREVRIPQKKTRQSHRPDLSPEHILHWYMMMCGRQAAGTAHTQHPPTCIAMMKVVPDLGPSR